MSSLVPRPSSSWGGGGGFDCVLMAFIRYGIEISNTVGRTKGHINLIIHQSPHETHVIKEVGVLKNTRITTNAVKKEEFGEHVARMHALNNKGFINQYQVSHDHHTCTYIISFSTMSCSEVCCLYTLIIICRHLTVVRKENFF